MKFGMKGSYTADIAVFGGGMAGISAALAAARMGRDVILVEKQCWLGGLATQGLITIFLPLCDGEGHQVTYGIAEELLKLSMLHGWEDRYPSAWLSEDHIEQRKKQRYEVQYNPHLFALEAEKLLLKNGVRIFYDTQLISLKAEEDRIVDSCILRKDGFFHLKVQQYIDTTGDLVAAQTLPLACESYDQNMPAAWYYSHSEKDGLKLRMLGVLETSNPNEKTEKISEDLFSGLYGDENDQIFYLSHGKMLEHFLQKKQSQSDYVPVNTPTVMQIRMSRRLAGRDILKEEDSFKRFEDSIGVIGNWKKHGPVYEVPYRCLYAEEFANLLTAGRSINVTGTMWDITRVIPGCCITGQAAGEAAALAMDGDARKLEISLLQASMREHGVRVHINEIDMD